MAEKKFFVDINLQGNKLANAVVGANGSMTTAGSFQYNNGRLEYYNGTTVEEVANLTDIQAVTGGLIFQGGYDASTNTPDIADGNTLKGFFWAVTVAGTFLGEAVQVGDSIVAKIDEAGATLSDWLILQGNVVIATDSVDGISRLATQTEANDGTEGGAVVITPATLQGKIDAQITPEINNKLPLAGGTMSGQIDMNFNAIRNVELLDSSLGSDLNANGHTITYLPTPTNGGDVANKTYVDQKSTEAESFAIQYADSLAPNYDPSGSATTAENNAKAYTDDLIGDATVDGTAGNTVKDRIDTAQANAESYADTRVDALNYSTFIQVADWVLDEENGGYYYIATHNLNTYSAISGFLFANSGEYVEFASEMISENAIKVKSNTIPNNSIIGTFYKGRI